MNPVSQNAMSKIRRVIILPVCHRFPKPVLHNQSTISGYFSKWKNSAHKEKKRSIVFKGEDHLLHDAFFRSWHGLSKSTVFWLPADLFNSLDWLDLRYPDLVIYASRYWIWAAAPSVAQTQWTGSVSPWSHDFELISVISVNVNINININPHFFFRSLHPFFSLLGTSIPSWTWRPRRSAWRDCFHKHWHLLRIAGRAFWAASSWTPGWDGLWIPSVPRTPFKVVQKGWTMNPKGKPMTMIPSKNY